MEGKSMGSVAITGLGPVSAIGTGVDTFWNSLLSGRSGFRLIERFELPSRACMVGAEVENPVYRPLDPVNPMPRAVQLGLYAARLAWTDAQLSIDPERVGVVVGTGVGNQDLIEHSTEKLKRGERVSPVTAFRGFAHSAACEIVRELDLKGPVQTLTSGCNSGADALGLALDWIRARRADAVLVGGIEAELCSSFLGVMTAARALTTKFNHDPEAASRPFDSKRDGNVPGEGAGFLVIESAELAKSRGARVRAFLKGYGSCAAGDRPPYDPFNPVFDSLPMVRTMRAALNDARVPADELSAVSANGSSSVFYDPLEAAAITELLGNRVASTPVYSIKGALGQTGAVTPALQAIAATLMVENDVIPPTCNVDDLDPRCLLPVVTGTPKEMNCNNVLANAIGFGGFYYASLVFGK
jgi:3-oxoacyl-[acyl-carrier-protein] synthase II